MPLPPSITGLNEGAGRYSPGSDVDHAFQAAMPLCSELMSRPKTKGGFRGISARADDARWVVSSRPRATVLQAALAAFVITGIFQMYFRAQNVGTCHQATDLPPQMISMSHHFRADFHPGRHHFARLTSGKFRYAPIRPSYERICTRSKNTPPASGLPVKPT